MNRFQLTVSAQRGFTLIELIAVLAIMAILMAVAIPSFQQSVERNAVSTLTEDFIGDLKLARSNAIATKRRTLVCRSADANAAAPTCDNDNNWSSGWIVYEKAPANNSLDFEVGDRLLKRQTLPELNLSSRAVLWSSATDPYGYASNGLGSGLRTFSMDYIDDATFDVADLQSDAARCLNILFAGSSEVNLPTGSPRSCS